MVSIWAPETATGALVNGIVNERNQLDDLQFVQQKLVTNPLRL